MKDLIIGSDEVLVSAIEQIEQHVAPQAPENLPPNGNEQNLNEDDQRHVPLVKTETFSTPLQDNPLYILSTH
jgi:hypothetical protein